MSDKTLLIEGGLILLTVKSLRRVLCPERLYGETSQSTHYWNCKGIEWVSRSPKFLSFPGQILRIANYTGVFDHLKGLEYITMIYLLYSLKIIQRK
jgi:hypothetical protein